jgi:hypothetical protein
MRWAGNLAHLVKLNIAYNMLLGSVKGREGMHDKVVEERIMID